MIKVTWLSDKCQRFHLVQRSCCNRRHHAEPFRAKARLGLQRMCLSLEINVKETKQVLERGRRERVRFFTLEIKSFQSDAPIKAKHRNWRTAQLNAQ